MKSHRKFTLSSKNRGLVNEEWGFVSFWTEREIPLCAFVIARLAPVTSRCGRGASPCSWEQTRGGRCRHFRGDRQSPHRAVHAVAIGCGPTPAPILWTTRSCGHRADICRWRNVQLCRTYVRAARSAVRPTGLRRNEKGSRVGSDTRLNALDVEVEGKERKRETKGKRIMEY